MNKVKQVRKAKGKLNQSELARKSEVSLKMIQLVEKQETGIEVQKALRIAEALKVNIKKIFDGNGFDKG